MALDEDDEEGVAVIWEIELEEDVGQGLWRTERWRFRYSATRAPGWRLCASVNRP